MGKEILKQEVFDSFAMFKQISERIDELNEYAKNTSRGDKLLNLFSGFYETAGKVFGNFGISDTSTIDDLKKLSDEKKKLLNGAFQKGKAATPAKEAANGVILLDAYTEAHIGFRKPKTAQPAKPAVPDGEMYAFTKILGGSDGSKLFIDSMFDQMRLFESILDAESEKKKMSGAVDLSAIESAIYDLNKNYEMISKQFNDSIDVMIELADRQADVDAIAEGVVGKILQSDTILQFNKTLFQALHLHMADLHEDVRAIKKTIAKKPETSDSEYKKQIGEINNKLVKNTNDNLATATKLNEIVGMARTLQISLDTNNDRAIAQMQALEAKLDEATKLLVAEFKLNQKIIEEKLDNLSSEAQEIKTILQNGGLTLDDKSIERISGMFRDNRTLADYDVVESARLYNSVYKAVTENKRKEAKYSPIIGDLREDAVREKRLKPEVVERTITEAITAAYQFKKPSKKIIAAFAAIGLAAAIAASGGIASIVDVANGDGQSYVPPTDSNSSYTQTYDDIENAQYKYFSDKGSSLSSSSSQDGNSFTQFAESIVVDGVIIRIPAYGDYEAKSYDISNLQDKATYTAEIEAQYANAENNMENLETLLNLYSYDDMDGKQNSTAAMKFVRDLIKNQEVHSAEDIKNAQYYILLHAKLVTEYEGIYGNGSSEGKSDVEMVVGLKNSGSSTTDYTAEINDAYDKQFKDKEEYNPDLSPTEKLEALKNIISESHDHDTIENAERYKELVNNIKEMYKNFFNEPAETDDPNEMLEIIYNSCAQDKNYVEYVNSIYKGFTNQDPAGVSYEEKTKVISEYIDNLIKNTESGKLLEVSKDLCGMFGLTATDDVVANLKVLYAIMGGEYEEDSNVKDDEPSVEVITGSDGSKYIYNSGAGYEPGK